MANQHIDEVILSDLKEVMEADFNRLITVYFDDARLRLDQLQSLVQAGDLSELRKTAHNPHAGGHFHPALQCPSKPTAQKKQTREGSKLAA